MRTSYIRSGQPQKNPEGNGFEAGIGFREQDGAARPGLGSVSLGNSGLAGVNVPKAPDTLPQFHKIWASKAPGALLSTPAPASSCDPESISTESPLWGAWPRSTEM